MAKASFFCVSGVTETAALLVVLAFSALPGTHALAAEGDPVAIRYWPDGVIGIENHWGLELRLSTKASSQSSSTKAGQPKSWRRLVGLERFMPHELARVQNEGTATWKPATDDDKDPNGIRIASVPAGATRPVGFLVDADGLRLVVLSGESIGEAAGSDPKSLGNVSGVVIQSSSAAIDLTPSLAKWINTLNPGFMVVPETVTETELRDWARGLGVATSIKTRDHNTFAASKTARQQDSMMLIRLAEQPFELSGELGTLFDKMDAACRESEKVFAKLSVNQLNFRPSNGTHTPRWNAEHMMGRQLVFFSQIYHALDPAIPVMDLNPKQMPPDYKAAHPNWNGEEEARQMERVRQFSRRFAYLLQDIDLDRRAPGSRWTLRGLLRQMERHYDDHTANTAKKFELPDWPSR